MTHSDRMLVFERWLQAPRELVFAAWTDPAQLAQWWGPNGFTLSTKQMEARVGGTWTFTMHGPDGRDYPNKIIFLELQPPERLVYQHSNDGATEPINFSVTLTLLEEAGGTRLRMEMLFDSAEDLQRVAKEYGAIEGAEQTLGRLHQLLASLYPAVSTVPGLEIVSTRLFSVDAATLYQAFTDPDLLRNWWGPRGFRNLFEDFDPRPGAYWYLTMQGPDGKEYPNEWQFIHFEPSLLIWHHRSAPAFHLRVSFVPEEEGTRLVFRMLFDTPATCNSVKEICIPANEENFDRLEKVLELSEK